MRKKWLIFILPLMLTGHLSEAQEIITGLLRNSQLDPSVTKTFLKDSKGDDTISLPFYDDFSRDTLYPSRVRWSDRMVYINNTFSVRQPSAGIATFDCLDERGLLYEDVSTAVFPADRLTSAPIDLQYSPSDSIYLSFLYEAGGIADMPERDDSLTLSFWAPGEKAWYSVWRTGETGADGFRKVMIPITSNMFLKKGFRFRFTGHASLSGILSDPARSGNADQWNIDHVYLNKQRTINDTVLHDVALTLPLRSLLKDYEAMPWLHFKQAFLSAMSPTASVYYRNNDTVIRNVTRFIQIKDLPTNTVVRDFNAGAVNVSPMSDIHFAAPLLYTYNSSSPDSALFLVTVWLITDDFDQRTNDTVRYLQAFRNYFALDDGTAEAGYGISGQGSRNAMFALRFRSFVPDSVTALRICFNDAYLNANQRAFEIMVWADDNGKPGMLLGSADGPVASPGTEINGFKEYAFNKPVGVNGDFWVGWRQSSETFLNVGLDLNTPPSGRQFFLISGNWEPSQVSGTVMIRPVIKGSGSSTSSDEGKKLNNGFRAFPNPTRGVVNLQTPDIAPEDYVIDVISLTGAKVMTVDHAERIDLSALAPGNYILVIRTSAGRTLSMVHLIKAK